MLKSISCLLSKKILKTFISKYSSKCHARPYATNSKKEIGQNYFTMSIVTNFPINSVWWVKKGTWNFFYIVTYKRQIPKQTNVWGLCREFSDKFSSHRLKWDKLSCYHDKTQEVWNVCGRQLQMQKMYEQISLLNIGIAD